MKILQVINCQYRRGAEVSAVELSDALAQDGHDVEVLALYKPPPEPLTPQVARVSNLGFDFEARGKLNPLLIWRLARYVREARPEVVQANGSDTLKYTALAKKISRGAWPLIYRNISVASGWLQYPLHRLWMQFLLRSVSRVASVAERGQEDFIETYGMPAAKVRLIRRGLDITLVSREEQRRRLARLGSAPADGFFLMHIGSFSAEKNHQWLLQAFKAILKEEPSAHLFLCGDGALRAAAEETVARRSLQGHVHFLGMRDDASALVAGADVLLLPSLIEGVPGVVLEAAVQRVPTIATDVGGIGEVVEDGERGRLVPLGDLEAFVAATLGLLRDAERRRRMGAAARAFVGQHYDVGEQARTFARLYSEA